MRGRGGRGDMEGERKTGERREGERKLHVYRAG